MEMLDPNTLRGLAVALGCGLLVGLERERRKGRGADREVAGLRSFAVAALAGALAAAWHSSALLAAGLLGLAMLLAGTRWGRTSHDPGVTTELALLATFLIGAWAVPQPHWAAVAALVLTLLLVARQRLHHFALRVLREEELHDGLLLAALALLALPLLPATPWPWLAGGSARSLGLLVLLLLGLQAAGHVALRALGAHAGLGLSGLLGGFVSSTATVASLGGQSRGRPPHSVRALAAAAAMSTVATWLQTLLMLWPLAPDLARGWTPVALVGAATALVSALWLTPPRDGQAPLMPQRRPLRPREALTLAALLTGVTVAVSWAQRELGEPGVLTGALLAGLMDAHAALPSLAGLAAQARIDGHTLHGALLLALAANSITRSLVAAFSGGWAYARWLLLALAAPFAVAWAADAALR